MHVIWGMGDAINQGGVDRNYASLHMVAAPEKELENVLALFDALGYWEIGYESVNSLENDLNDYKDLFIEKTELHEHYPEVVEYTKLPEDVVFTRGIISDESVKKGE